MSKIRIFADILSFAKENMLWWLLPIVILLAALIIFIVLTETSLLAPYVYTLF